MADSVFSKIVKSLWVLFALIPCLNGLGFAYIGAKKFNRKWILEGLIYEIPWLLGFIFIDFPNLIESFFIIGLILMLVSIIRTIMVYLKNQDSLIGEEDESVFDKNKILSSYWVIFSLIIFLNGIGLFIIGKNRNVKEWVYEGIIFEFLWVLSFILTMVNDTLSMMSVGLAMAGMVLSVICTFIAYFEEEKMNDFVSSEPIIDGPNSYPSSKTVENSKAVNSSSEVIPQFRHYNTEINNLKDTFNQKEGNIRDLINQRFNNEELSYDRFMSVINSCHKIFYHHADSASSIIGLASEYSERLDEAVKEKISILESINDEMNNLIEELILHDGDDGSEAELDELFSNMDDLINSVKDYK